MLQQLSLSIKDKFSYTAWRQKQDKWDQRNFSYSARIIYALFLVSPPSNASSCFSLLVDEGRLVEGRLNYGTKPEESLLCWWVFNQVLSPNLTKRFLIFAELVVEFLLAKESKLCAYDVHKLKQKIERSYETFWERSELFVPFFFCLPPKKSLIDSLTLRRNGFRCCFR